MACDYRRDLVDCIGEFLEEKMTNKEILVDMTKYLMR